MWKWFKKWAWLILAITAFVTGIVVMVCIGKGRQKSEPIQTFTRKAVDQVQKITEEIEAEKQEVRGEADEQREELQDIENEPEVRSRRGRLADWIADNL